ncbi:MAG: DUF1343 domain-containing protein [Bacilli bacterium]|nr:DUF1343 domain-containing protein [Bacilli bacterium]MDD3348971.1 DUF1343 domain-containing protein [Bacilli bacterium]
MIKLGIERIDDFLYLFKGKRVGLITNPTGIDHNFISTIDILHEKVNLVALFSPEHGVRGNVDAGVQLESYIDDKTGIIVHSLYGDKRRPSDEIMNNVDLICIDIQDVGSRFYTFMYTMAYCMIACKDKNKKFVVFDRPNPINGQDVEGNILDLNYRSFIGYYPIVQRPGMTIAELALLFNKEYEIGCDLEVVPMENYDRKQYFEETGCLWIMPSPNIPTPEMALYFNSTCVFEGTNVAEGRGTTLPFKMIGAPYIRADELANKMNAFGFKGIYFRPVHFNPVAFKYKGEMCSGVELYVFNRKEFTPVKVGWALLDVIRKLYPNDFAINQPYTVGRPCMLELNTGCSYIKENKYSLEEQFVIIDKETQDFIKTREKYLLY